MTDVRECEPDAWDRLFRAFEPMVYYWLELHGLQEADREDVAQEVFLTVSQKLDNFEYTRPGSFRAWVKAITTNKANDFHRGGKRQSRRKAEACRFKTYATW